MLNHQLSLVGYQSQSLLVGVGDATTCQNLTKSHAATRYFCGALSSINYLIVPVMIVGLRIRLAQHADADLHESAGLGLKVERCKFLHWAAGGAVRAANDAPL